MKALPPKKPTYGMGPDLVKMIRFYMRMKILEEANARIFAGWRAERAEGDPRWSRMTKSYDFK